MSPTRTSSEGSFERENVMRKGQIRAQRSFLISKRTGKGALLLAAMAVPLPALAANRTYTGATGLWSNTSNWNPVGLPTSSDAVFLQPSGTSSVTVTYDNTVGTNTTFLSLNINSTTTANITLLQTANLFTTSSGENIGDTGKGSFTFSGGTHTLSSGEMHIGNAASGVGTLSMSGGTLNASELDPGYSGTGTISQTGGLISAGFLSIGRLASGHGTYTLSTSGTLTVSNTLFVGEQGTGAVTQFGTATTATLSVGHAGRRSGHL